MIAKCPHCNEKYEVEYVNNGIGFQLHGYCQTCNWARTCSETDLIENEIEENNIL